MHPLKLISLIAWTCLLLSQVALLWPALEISLYWSLPLIGLLRARRYTYKWIGFLTLFYFCIGVSELAVNPELRLYGFATTLASLGLFLASIYYARYLGLQQQD